MSEPAMREVQWNGARAYARPVRVRIKATADRFAGELRNAVELRYREALELETITLRGVGQVAPAVERDRIIYLDDEGYDLTADELERHKRQARKLAEHAATPELKAVALAAADQITPARGRPGWGWAAITKGGDVELLELDVDAVLEGQPRTKAGAR